MAEKNKVANILGSIHELWQIELLNAVGSFNLQTQKYKSPGSTHATVHINNNYNEPELAKKAFWTFKNAFQKQLLCCGTGVCTFAVVFVSMPPPQKKKTLGI